jgi:5-hydroxyisourate hydrolase-like protein (transthyretin family)
MNSAKRCRPILALACCLIVLQSSYSQTPTSSKRSPATVSGRVTIKGKPAAGVAIGLRRMESNSIRAVEARAVTDQEGNYRITNVAEGSYAVIAFALVT